MSVTWYTDHKFTRLLKFVYKHWILLFLDSGSVMTWGWNEHGICGSEDETRNVHQPSVVSKLHDYITSLIGCGGGHSFAVVKG